MSRIDRKGEVIWQRNKTAHLAHGGLSGPPSCPPPGEGNLPQPPTSSLARTAQRSEQTTKLKSRLNCKDSVVWITVNKPKTLLFTKKMHVSSCNWETSLHFFFSFFFLFLTMTQGIHRKRKDSKTFGKPWSWHTLWQKVLDFSLKIQNTQIIVQWVQQLK